MATFFRSSEVWAVEYQYDGRTRHWLKAFPQGTDAERAVRDLLQELYGDHARLVAVRRATAQEEEDFRRGRLPRNAYCPTGKVPLGDIKPRD
jgi:hypothetical protein